MSRKSRQGYSIRHLLQLPNAPRSPPAAPHPPAPCIKASLRHRMPSPSDQDARDCDEEEANKASTFAKLKTKRTTFKSHSGPTSAIQTSSTTLWPRRPPKVARQKSPRKSASVFTHISAFLSDKLPRCQ
ncbi:uncharacterized protein LOC134648967 [Cydia amplana]|uniref:uncharacterized protein LOC134648967 n=1 Tax=Cydia amplana TaxID=1869771 RepID=UPI002FE5E5E3